MHPDAIRRPEDINNEALVAFIPFVGVGPRQFVDLFSLTLSSGAPVKRKKPDSFEVNEWKRRSALPRVKTLPVSYQDNELAVAEDARRATSAIEPIFIAGVDKR